MLLVALILYVYLEFFLMRFEVLRNTSGWLMFGVLKVICVTFVALVCSKKT